MQNETEKQVEKLKAHLDEAQFIIYELLELVESQFVNLNIKQQNKLDDLKNDFYKIGGFQDE